MVVELNQAIQCNQNLTVLKQINTVVNVSFSKVVGVNVVIHKGYRKTALVRKHMPENFRKNFVYKCNFSYLFSDLFTHFII